MPRQGAPGRIRSVVLGYFKVQLKFEELIGKNYDDVKDQIEKEIDCGDLDRAKIEDLLTGKDSDLDDDSDQDDEQEEGQESDGGKDEGPIEIDSTEEVIKLDDSDDNKKTERRSDRTSDRRGDRQRSRDKDRKSERSRKREHRSPKRERSRSRSRSRRKQQRSSSREHRRQHRERSDERRIDKETSELLRRETRGTMGAILRLKLTSTSL